MTNRTCHQCLCESNSSHLIINCLSNGTCQYFVTIPRTYKIQSTLNARLYFPQGIFPNASQCCTPNTSLLLSELNTAASTYVSVSGPRCLLLDSNGYLVTVSRGTKSIVRFDPNDLTSISAPASPIFPAAPYSIAHRNGAYYVGFSYYILVVHSTNMTQLHNISTSVLNSTRDIMFLDNGQTMVVVSVNNDRLLFFNRSGVGSYNYDFLGFQNVSCSKPHSLAYVNDTFFYLITWSNSAVCTYSNSGNMLMWAEQLVLNLSSMTNASNGAHISMDDCGRWWVSTAASGIQILDGQGSLLGTWKPIGLYVFDTLILDNYVIYISDSNSNKTMRIDLSIQC